MNNKKIAILDSLASSTPSKWREKAEWRIANRLWLRKSQKIAFTILECIYSKKIKQKDLAEKLNVSEQYISKVLKGSENLSLETITKFESVLGIQILSVNSCSEVSEIFEPLTKKRGYSLIPEFKEPKIFEEYSGKINILNTTNNYQYNLSA